MPDALVRQFMSNRVLTVEPGLSLREVASRMSEARVSCVVVCDSRNVPVGVVTERDLTGAYARDVGRKDLMPVSSAMSQGLLTLPATAACSEAMEIMRERGIRRLVIVEDDGPLAGIITRSDLLRAHTEEIELQKQLLEQRVQERTRELEALNRQLASMTRIDAMLGIGNRRAMDDELDNLEGRAKRYSRPYAVALLDVDHFKRYNDHYGHRAGDEALKQVASCVASDIRTADAVFRYGGEEFLIVFPEIDVEGARVAAEHVRASIEALQIPHTESPLGHLSVSIGVAGGSLDNPCWNAMVARADEALYVAKERGRNRVERGQPPQEIAA